jgi:hypothetical protein
MAFKTVNQLTQSVISLVGLVTGTGVQTYTEPQVRAAIQAQFDMLFIKRYWEWLTDFHTFTLDGTTGRVTSDISVYISDPTDICDIYIADTDRRVVKRSIASIFVSLDQIHSITHHSFGLTLSQQPVS